MVHKPMKIERQIKSKTPYKKLFTNAKLVTTILKTDLLKRDDNPIVAFKDGSKGKEENKDKSKVEVAPSRARDIQCF